MLEFLKMYFLYLYLLKNLKLMLFKEKTGFMNLLKSFAGESQARSRYTFFASVAKKEGYEQIAGVFMETAEQEKEHGKSN